MKKTLLNLVLIALTVITYFIFNHTANNIARVQNNFNLDNVITCTTSILNKEGYTKSSLTDALNICAKNTRSLGITGDIFVIRQSDKKLFWDGSLDCKPTEKTKLYMTKDNICKLFSEPETCIKAVYHILNNEPIGSLTWKFDDSKEYLDYRYIINNKGKELLIDNEKYIVVQGAQEDEIFNLLKVLIISYCITIIILLLIINY